MSDVGWCSNNTHVITSSGTPLPDLGAEACPTAAPTLAPTLAFTSAGSCYSVYNMMIKCDVEFSACSSDGLYWYQPGYMSDDSGCCHCRGYCNHEMETGTNCEDEYYDYDLTGCDICQGRGANVGTRRRGPRSQTRVGTDGKLTRRSSMARTRTLCACVGRSRTQL